MLSKKTLNFILEISVLFRFYIILQLIIVIIWASDFALKPYLIKAIINETANIGTGYHNLYKYATLYIGLLTLHAASIRVYDFVWLILDPEIQKYVNIKLMHLIIRSPILSQTSNFSTSLAVKVDNVANGIVKVVRITIEQFFFQILTSIIAVKILYNTAPNLSIIYSVWIVIFISGVFRFSVTGSSLIRQTAAVKTKLIEFKTDIINNILNINIFHSYTKEIKIIEQKYDVYSASLKIRDRFFINMDIFQSAIFVIYQLLCIYWLIDQLENNKLTNGDFILVLTINISLMQILWKFSYNIHNFSKYWSQIDQSFSTINDSTTSSTATLPAETHEQNKLKITEGEILCKDINFAYKTSSNIYKNFSLSTENSRKIGLVGYSGSGKSTFTRLLMRIYELQTGRIYIDNQDISKYCIQSLRNSIHLVTQDSILFHRSIKDNISYTLENVSDQEVVVAAELACAHQFISRLPRQYNTIIGENGVVLSGGERQRLLIARALIHKTPILILDEATSNIDPLTENLILYNISNLSHIKTILIITHRLTNLVNMDNIFVFCDGKIQESGAHQVLIDNNTLYKQMWDTQKICDERKVSAI